MLFGRSVKKSFYVKNVVVLKSVYWESVGGTFQICSIKEYVHKEHNEAIPLYSLTALKLMVKMSLNLELA